MKKIALIAAALVALTASAALAQPGINLGWSDCGGATNTAFACNSNSGAPFSLVASFVPPAGVDQMVGMAAQIDIVTDSATLPDWWSFGAAFCRGATALSTSFDFTSGPFTCSDPYAGQAAGGFAYDVGFGQPNRARLRVQCAVPADNPVPLDPTLEWYALKANVSKAKTTGTGSCAGCSTPACIVLNSVQLFQPLEVHNDPEIDAPGAHGNFVTWQSVPAGQASPCPQSTPTHTTTWGSLKSLYR